MHQEPFSVSLTLRDGYAFEVGFDPRAPPGLLLDEPPPLGEGRGPDPARLLAAAVGGCMSASLRYCLSRAHVEVRELRTTVEGTLVRNERGRLRIGRLRVRLEPGVEEPEKMGRCLELFEDFCVVGQSVREGIGVEVEVAPATAAGGAGAAR